MFFLNFFNNKLLFNGIIISFFLGLSGLIAYGNQILVIDYLSINDYITYTYFFSIFALMSSSLGGLSFVFIKSLSLLNKNYFFIRLNYLKNSKFFLILLSILFLFTYVFNKQISNLINLEISYIYLILLYFGINFFLVLNSALFCSQKLFNLFSFNNIGQTLVRTTLLLFFMFFKLKLIFIILSAILSAFIIFCINIFSLIKIFKFNKAQKNINTKVNDEPYSKKFVINNIISNFIITFFLQSDIILIKSIFEDQNEVGSFYIAAILGKGVLYITLGFVSAFFPVSSTFKKNSKNNSIHFYRYILYSILTSLLLIIFFFLFSDPFLRLFFNDKINIENSIFILKFYGVIILPFAVINLFESYLISRGKFLFTWIGLIFLPIYLFFAYFFSYDLYYFLSIYFLSGLAIITIGSLYIIFSKSYGSEADIFYNHSSKGDK